MSAPNMNEHLASWTEGPARAAIVGFVDRVTAEGGPDHVPPPEREFHYTDGAEHALDAARAEGWTVPELAEHAPQPREEVPAGGRRRQGLWAADRPRS